MGRHRKKPEERMIEITLHLPPQLHNSIKKLVEQGFYPNVSEYIRHALYMQLWRDRKMIEFYNKYVLGTGTR